MPAREQRSYQCAGQFRRQGAERKRATTYVRGTQGKGLGSFRLVQAGNQ